MKKRYFVGDDRIYIYDGQTVEEVIESVLIEEEVEDEKPIKKKQKGIGIGKGKRHCKKCGKPGHRADGCPGEEINDDDESVREQDMKGSDFYEDELCTMIRDMWVDQNIPAPKVCLKLKISLGMFNR